jgi:hypothetical protein
MEQISEAIKFESLISKNQILIFIDDLERLYSYGHLQRKLFKISKICLKFYSKKDKIYSIIGKLTFDIQIQDIDKTSSLNDIKEFLQEILDTKFNNEIVISDVLKYAPIYARKIIYNRLVSQSSVIPELEEIILQLGGFRVQFHDNTIIVFGKKLSDDFWSLLNGEWNKFEDVCSFFELKSSKVLYYDGNNTIPKADEEVCCWC